MTDNVCPRVEMRMECPECGYPYSEAALELDTSVPHKDPIQVATAEDVGCSCLNKITHNNRRY